MPSLIRATTRHRQSALVAGCGPVVAWSVLSATGAADAALAAHVTAPFPFGWIHDLRWVAVLHESWGSLTVAVLVALAARTSVIVAIVRGAQATPEPLRQIALRVIGAEVVIAAFAWPWISLLYSSQVVSLSWPFIAGVGPLILIVPWVAHAPATPGWWCRRPPAGVVAWSTATFVVITLLGGVMAATAAAWSFLAVVAAGAWHAFGWMRIVRACEASRDGIRSSLTGPVLGLPLTTAMILAAGLVGLEIGVAEDGGVGPVPNASRVRYDGPVLVLSGFEVGWEGERQRWFGSRAAQRFSYGESRTGHPSPYGARETLGDLFDHVAEFEAQVRALARRSGRPVSVVAESEGSLVARVAITTVPDLPVDRLVLVSPLLSPGRLSYPPPGQQAAGLAVGWGLRGPGALASTFGPLSLVPDTAILRSINRHATALEDVMRCPTPGVEVHAFVPALDALGHPRLDSLRDRPIIVRGVHGQQLNTRSVQGEIATLLQGAKPNSHGASERWYLVLERLAAGWHVPTRAAPPPSIEECREAGVALQRAYGAHAAVSPPP